jgi:hypothetical protein
VDPELADSRCAPTRLLAKFLQTQRDQRLLQTQGERQNIVTVAVSM